MLYLSGLHVTALPVRSETVLDRIDVGAAKSSLKVIAEGGGSPIASGRGVKSERLIAESNIGEEVGSVILDHLPSQGVTIVRLWVQMPHPEFESIFLALLKALLRRTDFYGHTWVAFPVNTRFPAPYGALLRLQRSLPRELAHGKRGMPPWGEFRWLPIPRWRQRLALNHPLLLNFLSKLPHRNIIPTT